MGFELGSLAPKSILPPVNREIVKNIEREIIQVNFLLCALYIVSVQQMVVIDLDFRSLRWGASQCASVEMLRSLLHCLICQLSTNEHVHQPRANSLVYNYS